MRFSSATQIVTLITSALIFTSCYIESHESDETSDDSWQSPSYDSSWSPSYNDIPDNYLLIADVCERDDLDVRLSEEAKKKLCFENDDYKWNTTCRGGACQAIPVYVQYMLSQDLGEGRTVTIEAFDNPRFGGNPVSSVTIQNFSAKKAGQFEQATLYLGQGTYYARAFISKADDTVIPYEYSDMQLVENKPLGVFGALSSPATITVNRISDEEREPMYITIDKLFKKPGQEEDHRAHLRLKLTLQKGAGIENDRDIIIQLLEEDDIQLEPKYQFTLPSASLKVEGRQGETEFVSDSLELGSYFVFVFVDENSNGYYDEGELAQYYGTGSDMRSIAMQERRTKYLALELSPETEIELN